MIAILIFLLIAPPVMESALIGAIYWQARTDQTRPVDAIVVLGAAQYNGRPSSVLRARLDRAYDIFEGGYAPFIIVTGGGQPGDAFTEAETGQAYLIGRGVREDAILLENEGLNSWESMVGVERIVSARGFDDVLLVSDGFHLLRLKLMARDLKITAFASAATDSPIQGGREFSYVVRESVAVVAHLFGYRS